MKKIAFLLLLAFVVAVTIGVYAAPKEDTFEGTLVDSKCYLKDNSLTGNDHMGVTGCGTICLKAGNTPGLLTKNKTYHAIIAPAPVLAPYVGQETRVRGTLHNGAILAEKVEVKKDGKWEEVKLGVMM